MECVWLGIGGALGPDTGGWWVTGWGWWLLSDWCNHSARVGEWLLRFLVRQIHIQVQGIFFPECVARISLSLWGLKVRNRPQPSATVRAIPVCPCLWEVLQRWSFFVRRIIASFCVAGAALRDIQTYSGTCRKSFCVTGAIGLRHVQKIYCSFRGRCNTLNVSIVIFHGRRSTIDVSGAFFCQSHWKGRAKCWQGANSMADLAFSVMWL